MARYVISGTFALAAGTAKTVGRIMTPATRKGTLRRLQIIDSKAGASDQGILARVLTGGTDGTGTAVTPTPLEGAAACLATANLNYTVEPTGSPTEVFRTTVPSGGGIDLLFEERDGIQVPHSSALGFEFTAAEARGSNVVSFAAYFDE